MPTILSEIVDFLDQLGIQKEHFLGEATSGAVGEVLAAMYPERVASLITCSSPTHLPPQAIELFCVG
jgi:pimeloyl-ACP methyl ester carboxylesterase